MLFMNYQVQNSTPIVVINQLIQGHKLTPCFPRHAFTHEESVTEMSKIYTTTWNRINQKNFYIKVSRTTRFDTLQDRRCPPSAWDIKKHKPSKRRPSIGMRTQDQHVDQNTISAKRIRSFQIQKN